MDPDFEEHLTDTAHAVVAFAGGPQNRFQFRNVLGKLGVSHVLLQDSTQRYFLDGVKGIGDRDAVVKYLRRLMYERHEWVTTVGVSSGSYAALFYGQLAPVDEVIAISPLTTRQPSADIDPRWHSQIFDPSLPDLPDLKDFFPGGPVPRVRAFISDGDGCWIDRQMAQRIGCEEITLVSGFAHGDLARGMRDRGMFTELFR